jgi:hypothetical protein
MKDEYVVINKTALDKRIEELKFFIKIGKGTNPELIKACELRIDELNMLKSISLNPILQEAIIFGNGCSTFDDKKEASSASDFYVSTLKIAL